MIVYRITLEKWAYQIYASGYAARWNRNDQKVLYTASSRSLACLENMVHRNGRGLNASFRTMVIEIPDNIPVKEVSREFLHDEWEGTSEQSYEICRNVGSAWLSEAKFPVLKVPSAIISNEFNYLINMHHHESTELQIVDIEPFIFDNRLKKL